jgi:PAS domain S-box-containing protein
MVTVKRASNPSTLVKPRVKETKQSVEQFQKLIDEAPIGICSVDLKGKFTYVNKRFEEVSGYSREEVLGKNGLKLGMVPPETVKTLAGRMANKLRGRPPRLLETQFRCKDGQWIWVAIEGRLIKNSGIPTGFQLTARDITERKLAEEKYKTLVEDVPIGIYFNDFGGTFLYGNKKAEEITGYKREELLGKSFLKLKLLDPKELGRAIKLLALNKLGKATGPDRFALNRKDGTKSIVEIHTRITTVGGKKVVLGMVEDITERKQAEQALADEVTRRRILIDQSLDGIVVLDVEARVVEANQRFAEMLGYTPEEVRKLHTWDWDKNFPPEKLLEMGRAVDEKGLHLETRHHRKDGSVIDVDISINGTVVAGQKLIFCVCRDITARKKREQLQRDENYVLTLLGQGAELNELLDSILRLGESHDPAIKGSVMLFDSTKGLLFLASAPSLPDDYKKLFEGGLPIGPTAGACGTAAYRKERVAVPDIANSPLFKPFAEAVKGATRNGLSACWSQPIISSKGELLGTIANYATRVGEPSADNLQVLEWSARIAAIAIERRRAEEALRKSEEKFSKAFRASPSTVTITTFKDGKFLELNDTFTRLSGYSREELIGRCSSDIGFWVNPEDRNRMLQIIKEQGRVNNEEFNIRRKSGEIRTWLFSMEPIDIGGELCILSATTDITERKQAEEALKEAHERLIRSEKLAAIGQLAGGVAVPENVTVVTDVSPELPMVMVDASQIQQVFVNVILNALEAMPESGRLEIRASSKDDFVTVECTDTGSGIPEAVAGKIFEPLFTTKAKGIGLGLAMSKNIMERHGGDIVVQSKEGEGTTFTISLPTRAV